MNINWNPISRIFSNKESIKRKDGIKSEDASKDRDPSGGFGYSQNNKGKEVLSDEELQEAVLHLESLEAIRSNNFKVKIEETSQTKVVLIIDQNEKILRRIPQSELKTLVQNYNERRQTGALLNKKL